jgi:hypothetical protein
VQVLTGFGGDAEAVEALVCKTGLSGFESHRYLQIKASDRKAVMV